MHPKHILALITIPRLYLLAVCVVEQMLESCKPGFEFFPHFLQAFDLEWVYELRAIWLKTTYSSFTSLC